MTEFFPPSFMTPHALEDVISWIRSLPLDSVDRKELLMDWASIVGVSLSGDDVLRAIPELREEEGRR
ncbi:hypothetical protein ES703_112002 [subsurface metagenome]